MMTAAPQELRPTDLKGFKAISYARFSSDAQRGGTSIARQETNAKAFCETYGLDLIDSVNDEALSAYHRRNLDTGGLGRILEALRDGKIDTGRTVLLVEQLDRITRDKRRLAARMIEDTLAAGLHIVTLKDSKVWTIERLDGDIGAAIMLAVELTQAHAYSDNLSRRVAASYQMRLNAATSEQRPFRVRKLPWWIDRASYSSDGFPAYKAEPKAAETMRQTVRWILDDDLGVPQVVQRLNSDRRFVEAGKAGSWSISGMFSMLRNTALYGSYTHMGEELAGFFEPVIDETTFLRMRGKFDQRHAKPKRKTSTAWLQGTLVCGHCGAGAWIRSGNGQRYVICSAKQQQGKQVCDAPNVNLKIVEREVLNRLGSLASMVPEDAPSAAEIEAIEQEINGTRQRYENATAMAFEATSELMRRDAQNAAEKAAQRLEELARSLKAKRAESAYTGPEVLDLEEIEGTIRGLIEAGEYLAANTALKRIVDKVIVEMPDGLRIKMRGRAKTLDVWLGEDSPEDFE